MDSHHSRGTGGRVHCAGSELSGVWVGTTSVPSGPSAASSACTTACGPPGTKPRLRYEEWVSSTPPGVTPSARRSAVIERIRIRPMVES